MANDGAMLSRLSERIPIIPQHSAFFFYDKKNPAPKVLAQRNELKRVFGLNIFLLIL
jgi:hypothetical protein